MECKVCGHHFRYRLAVRGGADKSLARPGGKQAMVKKTGHLFNLLPTKLNTLLSPLL